MPNKTHNILVLGSGGREHALCWKIAQSPLANKVFCAPGNAGSALCATNTPLALDDAPALIAFCRQQSIALVVIGSEAPLVAGIADQLRRENILVFGPSARAARLEASKAFARQLCDEANIPGARWKACTTFAEAQTTLEEWGAPIVIKADGLAAGKGVVVAETLSDAEAALDAMMNQQSFGDAANVVVLEECLVGLEASLFVLCDHEQAMPLALARDHKRIGEGDTGANTGGMGCFTPIGDDQAIIHETMTRIIQPSLSAMMARGTPFQGVLFAGLMLTQEGAKLIEYNVRFGDPECQALMLQMNSDVLPLLLATAKGTLHQQPAPLWHEGCVVNVVLASPGYPDSYAKALPLPDIPENTDQQVIFHAGTVRDCAGNLLTAGGRVLNVCARGEDLNTARRRAYQAIDNLGWHEGYYRRDIGKPS